MLAHGWLFPGRSCTDPISTRQINRATHEAAEAAGIRKRVSPHTRRHYVSFLLMSGNVARVCALDRKQRMPDVKAWLASQHSLGDFADCWEGSAGGPEDHIDPAHHVAMRFRQTLTQAQSPSRPTGLLEGAKTMWPWSGDLG